MTKITLIGCGRLGYLMLSPAVMLWKLQACLCHYGIRQCPDCKRNRNPRLGDPGDWYA